MARLTVADLEARAKAPAVVSDKAVIKVGLSTCGLAAGAEPVFIAINAAVKERGMECRVARTGCAGLCSMEPLVEVALPGKPPVMYGEVTPELAERIVEAIATGKALPAESRAPSIGELAQIAGEPVAPDDAPKQYRIVMRNCGVIDPEEIDEYARRGETPPPDVTRIAPEEE